MFKKIHEIFQYNSDNQESHYGDSGCIYCSYFTGQGCKIGNPNFPSWMNVMSTPIDCPKSVGPFDKKCKELNRTPSDECWRIIQNITCIAKVLSSEKLYMHADLLENAAESYRLLFEQAYPNGVSKK